jgi:hypothetical protein
MCDNWYESMDNGKLTGVVFLDIRKAFDSIDHVILLEKLAFYTGPPKISKVPFQKCSSNWVATGKKL